MLAISLLGLSEGWSIVVMAVVAVGLVVGVMIFRSRRLAAESQAKPAGVINIGR